MSVRLCVWYPATRHFSYQMRARDYARLYRMMVGRVRVALRRRRALRWIEDPERPAHRSGLYRARPV